MGENGAEPGEGVPPTPRFEVHERGCNAAVINDQLVASLSDKERASMVMQAVQVLLATIPQGASLYVEVRAGGLVAIPGAIQPGAPTDYLIVTHTVASATIKSSLR